MRKRGEKKKSLNVGVMEGGRKVEGWREGTKGGRDGRKKEMKGGVEERTSGSEGKKGEM